MLLCYLLLASVDERLSLAFEIGLEWVVCHKTGLSTTFATTPSTMTKIMKLKPQVEGLSIFKKAGMVGPLELNVVNRPFSWRAVSSMLISVPELTQLFVSCGDIRTVLALWSLKTVPISPQLERGGRCRMSGAGWLGWFRPVCGTSIVCDTSA